MLLLFFFVDYSRLMINGFYISITSITFNNIKSFFVFPSSSSMYDTTIIKKEVV